MTVAKFVFILMLVQVPFARAADITPKHAAAAFYAWVIKHDGGGIPSEPALKAGEEVLSMELTQLLRSAKAKESQCVALTPEDLKPSIFEGSLFVDNYEGVTKVVSMRVQPNAGGMVVTSNLEYRYQLKDSGSNAVKWTDRLLLVRERGKWVVEDIPARPKTKSLAATLKDYINAECRW